MSRDVTTKVCPTCDDDGYVDILDDDGYVDILDDWGGVIGPAPCPTCGDANLDRSDLGLDDPSIDYADDPWS